MLILNTDPAYRQALDPADAATLGADAAAAALEVVSLRPEYRPTPLHALPGLARELGVAAVQLKDEGHRLGLGSFKALGGAYAVIRIVQEEAGRVLGRTVEAADLQSPDVRAVAAGLTFCCATDGNHGRSVAQGAQLVGAKAAIARFGAEMVRVDGTYDDSVEEAARVADRRGWTLVSDTSWPGYERVPGLVMQGYTVLVHEALAAMPEPPTHVFVQAGVGGIAAAAAAHMALVLGDRRPVFTVVEPERAACIFACARDGGMAKIAHGEPSVMAMLECYEPSLVAWRVLSRVADAFMTVTDDAAVAVMNRLARPAAGDPAIVAGESGGAGLAGLIAAAGDTAARAAIGLDEGSRVLVVNTEGATDAGRYRELVGMDPAAVG